MYRFIVDPGHGWLEVPVREVRELERIGVEFSSFSFLDQELGQAYLEEDLDAGLFISARQLSEDDWDYVHIEEFDRTLPRLVSDRELNRREADTLGDPNAVRPGLLDGMDLGGGLLFSPDVDDIEFDPNNPHDVAAAALEAPVLHKVTSIQGDRVTWRDVPAPAFRALVRGVGESNFSGNGVEFSSVAAAVSHAVSLFSNWWGCDAWAVIPVQCQPDAGGRWTPGLVAAMAIERSR